MAYSTWAIAARYGEIASAQAETSQPYGVSTLQVWIKQESLTFNATGGLPD